jgi:hypothetical protein
MDYNFGEEFSKAILDRRMDMTLRPAGIPRHVEPGETLSLYEVAMKSGRMLLGRATCVETAPVRIDWKAKTIVTEDGIPVEIAAGEFATRNGFKTWKEMEAYAEEKGLTGGQLYLIRWEPAGFSASPQYRDLKDDAVKRADRDARAESGRPADEEDGEE